MSHGLIIAFVTATGILWIFARLSAIVIRQRKPLQFHVKQALLDRGRTQINSIMFALHVVVGLAITGVSPYLAYLCVPPPGKIGSTDTNFGIFSMHKQFLILCATIMTAVFLSVLWLIPHPSKYQMYGCNSERGLTRGISLLVVSALQFTAMGIVPLGLLVPVLRTPLTVVAVVTYFWTCVVCAAELANFAWERMYMRFGLHWIIGKIGPKTKSKLTQAFLGAEAIMLQAQWIIFLVVGAIGGVQCLFMLLGWFFQQDNPVSQRQEMFYVIAILLQNVIMGRILHPNATDLSTQRGRRIAEAMAQKSHLV
mmetsp:Transcript_2780/g.4162  ORF Transcript_2780/g.4162 Transcript_2780/m.4162 type:complete len:310 (-) Transcript_2780:373-1302(-)